MAQVKYHLCADCTIRTENEIEDTSIINSTLVVDTDFTKHLKDKDIKDMIYNYIYGDSVQPVWLTDNRKHNCIWKGKP